MTIAFDVGTSDVRTLTGNPQTKAHIPVGIVRLMVVMAVHGTSSTDHWTGAVTYGGVAMSRVILSQDTVTEPGAAVIYWLGSGIPQGTQTISMTLATATTDDIAMYGMSFTASGDCYLVTSGRVQENAANPSVSLTANGLHSMAVAAFYYGGLIAGSTITAGNTEHGPNNDAGGVFSYKFGRTTTADSANKSIGWTAVTDDVALAAALFSEYNPERSKVFSYANIIRQ